MASIREDIKQARPFRSIDHESIASLIRTTSDLIKQYDDLLSREDVTLTQYNVLRVLRGAGGPLCTMTIGERLLQRTPGITRLLDRLEKKGYIKRMRSTVDRREVYCELTKSGRKLVDRLDNPIDEKDRQVLFPLTSSEKKVLIDLLRRVREELR